MKSDTHGPGRAAAFKQKDLFGIICKQLPHDTDRIEGKERSVLPERTSTLVLEKVVAQRQLLPRVQHRQSRYLNNRAENSHRPTGRRERQMQRFKSPKQAQDFLSAYAFIHGHFHPRRHQLKASTYRTIRSEAFNVWQQETCIRYAS
jgi:hypothetical protein